MSVMGMLGTNLSCATRVHRPYRDALRAIKSRGGFVERPDEAKSLLAVLTPLCHHLGGKAYFSLGVNGEEMSKFLYLRHREGWLGARDGILSVKARLEEVSGERMALSGEDVSILGDVSDALGSICASLFERMYRL